VAGRTGIGLSVSDQPCCDRPPPWGWFGSHELPRWRQRQNDERRGNQWNKSAW